MKSVGKMNLKDQIRVILKEETNPLNFALRRAKFTEEDLLNHMKRYVLRSLDESTIKDACDHTAYEVLETGMSDVSDADFRNALDQFSKKLQEKYGDFIEDYIISVSSYDDNETYCFKKHSDKHMRLEFNSGFGECV